MRPEPGLKPVGADVFIQAQQCDIDPFDNPAVIRRRIIAQAVFVQAVIQHEPSRR
jgi:hypothetical protein